ncbi:WD40 repeat-like protein, partial [Sistotremastrum suecicum HHB10207 ss-3]
MKAGVIRSWWENAPSNTKTSEDPVEPTYSPVYSLLLHSDALWGLSGSKDGRIGLYTVRHQPGTMCHTLHAHKGPVSAMALLPDQKGFFSVGWDGNALQWDLNTGQIARSFPSQGAQLSAVALRPVYLGADTGLMAYGASVAPATAPPSDAFRSPTSSPIEQVPPAITSQPRNTESSNVPASTKPNDSADVQHNVELKSEASYDPLFDEPDLENAEGAFFDRPARSSFSSPEKPAPAPQKPAPSGLAVPGEPVAQFRTGKPVTNTNASTGGHYRNPVLDSSMAAKFSHDVLLTAAIDGQVILWDRRVQSPSGGGVGRLEMADKTPPWCVSACWSSDGMHIYAGRRNGTVDVWDTRQLGRDGAQAPRLLRTLRNPPSSGEVSCVAAFPDGRHIACASNDNIRLWNTSESPEESRSRTTPFKIVTGHHGGNVSQMLIDPAARFMISASGNRGWFGDSTRTVLVHEIKAL